MKKILILIMAAFLVLSLSGCGEKKYIKQVGISAAGNLVVVYNTGAQEVIGPVVGKDGKDGVNGKDGADGKDATNNIIVWNNFNSNDIENYNSKLNITYSDSKNYILEENKEFECLAVYNYSNNIAGEFGSYIVACNSSGKAVDSNFVFTCIDRKAGVNYQDYVRNCKDKTAPGLYFNGTEYTEFGTIDTGVYFLFNAKIEIINSNQVIISYDSICTPLEYINNLL